MGTEGDELLPSDRAEEQAALLRRVRDGDKQAYEDLYAEHIDSVRRLASILAGPEAAEDLVSDAFAKVLAALQDGGGPRENFRAYLHTTIRNRHTDALRGSRERPSSDMPWVLDSQEPAAETLVAGIDSNGAVAALSSLPGTWQTVLWHLEVEGRRPAEVAELLTMSPAAVSSLAYRAREGLRQAYLDQHLQLGDAPPRCQWTRDRLSSYVRADLSTRASAKVKEHLSTCAACAAAYSDLDTLNKKLAAYLFPVVLVGGMAMVDAAAAAGGSGAAGFTPGRWVKKSQNAGQTAGQTAGRSAGRAASQTAANAGGILGAASTPVAAAVAGLALVVVAGSAVWAISATRDSHDGPDHPRVSTAGGPADDPTDTPQTDPPPVEQPVPTPTPSPDRVQVVVPVVDVEPPAEPATAPPAPAPDPPALVRVRPVAPIATPISACDTYGSLELPTTPGVRYRLSAGDGLQGTWTVRAAATAGHVIAAGAPTVFTGDLGVFEPCPVPPTIGALSKVPTGDPVNDPWAITVTPSVTDPDPATLTVAYAFSSGSLIQSRTGDGWTCREPGGTEVGVGQEFFFPDPTTFTCTFDYVGQPPPPVTLTMFATDANAQTIEPVGSVSLARDGVVTDERTLP